MCHAEEVATAVWNPPVQPPPLPVAPLEDPRVSALEARVVALEEQIQLLLLVAPPPRAPSTSSSSSDRVALGAYASLTEAGYKAVADSDSEGAMLTFKFRVMESMPCRVRDVSAILGTEYPSLEAMEDGVREVAL